MYSDVETLSQLHQTKLTGNQVVLFHTAEVWLEQPGEVNSIGTSQPTVHPCTPCEMHSESLGGLCTLASPSSVRSRSCPRSFARRAARGTGWSQLMRMQLETPAVMWPLRHHTYSWTWVSVKKDKKQVEKTSAKELKTENEDSRQFM